MDCIFCKWEYNNWAYHICKCGKEINLAESDGCCNDCLTIWDFAQCPRCGDMGLIVDEPELSKELTEFLENEGILTKDETDLEIEKERIFAPLSHSICQFLLCHKSLGEDDVLNVRLQIIKKAQKWLASKEDYFQYCPTAREEYDDILEEDAEFEAIIDSGMNQISNNIGFELETPLRHLDVFGFNRLIRILRLESNKRTTDHGTMINGYVVDQFELSCNTGDSTMFNRVDYPVSQK